MIDTDQYVCNMSLYVFHIFNLAIFISNFVHDGMDLFGFGELFFVVLLNQKL